MSQIAAVITPRDAYWKGYRSGESSVDSDVAHERFSRKYCAHPYTSRNCNLDHAWWNGFDESGSSRPRGHALTCPLGVACPDGHGDCPDDGT